MKVSRKTISKVAHGNIDNICQSDVHSVWDAYNNEILDGIRAGKTGKQIFNELLRNQKCVGHLSSFYEYLSHLTEDTGTTISKYHRRPTPSQDGSNPGEDSDIVSRNGVLQYLWDNQELSQHHLEYLCSQYPIIRILKKRILEFREIFHRKNPYLLFLFIDSCKAGDCRKLARFADGLTRDFEAVLNAVVTDFSNGFVEGTNNKIKMVKRVMYGRCKLPLLRAKLIGRRLEDILPSTA